MREPVSVASTGSGGLSVVIVMEDGNNSPAKKCQEAIKKNYKPA